MDVGVLSFLFLEVKVEIEFEIFDLIDVKMKQFFDINFFVEEFMLFVNISVVVKIYEVFFQMVILCCYGVLLKINFDEFVNQFCVKKGMELCVDLSKVFVDFFDKCVDFVNLFFNIFVCIFVMWCMMSVEYFCFGI